LSLIDKNESNEFFFLLPANFEIKLILFVLFDLKISEIMCVE